MSYRCPNCGGSVSKLLLLKKSVICDKCKKAVKVSDHIGLVAVIPVFLVGIYATNTGSYTVPIGILLFIIAALYFVAGNYLEIVERDKEREP